MSVQTQHICLNLYHVSTWKSFFAKKVESFYNICHGIFNPLAGCAWEEKLKIYVALYKEGHMYKLFEINLPREWNKNYYNRWLMHVERRCTEGHIAECRGMKNADIAGLVYTHDIPPAQNFSLAKLYRININSRFSTDPFFFRPLNISYTHTLQFLFIIPN